VWDSDGVREAVLEPIGDAVIEINEDPVLDPSADCVRDTIDEDDTVGARDPVVVIVPRDPVGLTDSVTTVL
jgi:hypothetical protein